MAKHREIENVFLSEVSIENVLLALLSESINYQDYIRKEADKVSSNEANENDEQQQQGCTLLQAQ